MRYFIFIFLYFITPVNASSFEFGEIELLILKGNKPGLTENEGYLYLPFKSNAALDFITLDHLDSGKKLKFKNVDEGAHHALIKLKAGKYYWKQIKIDIPYYQALINFEKDEHQLVVKPGIVNYPGNWDFSIKWKTNLSYGARLSNTNKFAYEYQHIKNDIQNIVGMTPIQFSGEIKDNYPQHINQLLLNQEQIHSTDINFQPLEKDNKYLEIIEVDDGVDKQKQQFPLLNDYVKNNDRQIGDMSPNGRFIIHQSETDDMYRISVLNTQTLKSFVVLDQKLDQSSVFSNFVWIDNNSFIYDYYVKKINSKLVVHLNTDSKGHIKDAEQLLFPFNGQVVNQLIKKENKLLLATYNNLEITSGLYEVDTSNKKRMKKSFRHKIKYTKNFKNVAHILTDKEAKIRSVIELTTDKKTDNLIFNHWFLKRIGKKYSWVKINSGKIEDDTTFPLHLSNDGKFFYSITNIHGDLKAIHKYSTEDYKHLGLYYQDPQHDITGIKLDPETQELTAYYVTENGTRKFNFFNHEDDRVKHLKERNPDVNVYVKQHNPETGNVLLLVTTSYSKGAWYLYNEISDKTHKLFDNNKTYENLPKGDSHVLKIKSDDGYQIEGYLVKPSITPKDSLTPLVVIPHGGPIGVRDYADNDVLQHFFASHGMATLKVNYRGSSGFGKTFKEMGNGEWGGKIEADIHKMVVHTAQKFELNPDKICALGASYGGYSSMMLTYLYPEWYQCAISFAGISDLPLMFSGISVSADDLYKEELAKIVGSPKKDYDLLVKKSPFYQVQKMTKPIKLIHGELDDIVSLEQSIRMVQALNLTGNPSKLSILKDEKHSLKYIYSEIFYMAESLKFIQDKLKLKSTAKTYIPEPKDIDKEDENTVLDYLN